MTRRMKRHAKVAVAHILYYSGALLLWKAIVMRNRAVVLMYHRVLTEEERRQSGSHPALVVERATFAKQMALLKRRFSVLSVDDLADRLERKVPLPSSSVMITFDDGWRDNFTNALPILRRHTLPALVFLPVNYIGGTRLFWQEALTQLLRRIIETVRRNPAERDRFLALLKGHALGHLLDPSNTDEAPRIARALDQLKPQSRETIASLVDTLAEAVGLELSELSATDGFIDWSQAGQMAKEGISFGGHGVEHLLLTYASSDEADREIGGAKRGIESRLAMPVSSFSFPNGYWTPELVQRVKAAGYRLSFITKRGFVSCNDDPFTLRRLNVHEAETGSMPMFMARIVGLW
jgi:peptidoglycan/xylan/chitin deacetylase (PgdA/CDA1 family)